jgi:hypothetical protein
MDSIRVAERWRIQPSVHADETPYVDGQHRTPKMSDGLTGVLREWLAGVGHLALGEQIAPKAVTLRREQSAVLASLEFEGKVRMVAVKRLSGSRIIGCPVELSRIHEAVRACSSLVASSTPRFLAHSPEHKFVVMEYVEGPTLLSALTERPTGEGGDLASCQLARRAGALLAEFHSVTFEAARAVAEPRANWTYVEHWAGLWHSLAECRGLRVPLRDSRRILDHLSPQFFGRTVARLHPVDVQPKNILVPAPSRLCLIDPDYSWANPALGVGQFLASLDRVRLRSRRPDLAESIRCWKRAFLDGYSSRNAGALNEDVLFFYSWALLRMQRLHESRLPWMRLILRRFYAARLTCFLVHLERSVPSGTLPAGTIPAELLTC